ncbi:hypothetical protein [Flavisolibacter ginsenosidimutans]|uniref:Uncharacterized protein n=1 Tax=Flavisolibacter ginsenosidimutans TaxID=661481 RepID=A0A5B8UIC4_9BACT|nr:hypothetical protein [Flavisolibacter ginsenosidimutans]QEC56298.1 hypothetical protein FSB75_10470 [Flavisolibacter ginsenosidimutans]
MTPINVGSTDSYASLPENSMLSIPIKYNSTCDSGIASAVYKVVNNRASDITLVQSPGVPISFNGKVIDTTIKVPVRKGLMSVVIIINDKCGHISSKSVDVKSVVPSSSTVKTLTNVVMSTDPADNQNFFSFYEPTPVFGQAVALTKQSRIDFIAINMSGARFIATNAYAADANYYNASKGALAGFTTLNYTFLSATKAYVNSANFDAISTEADLAKYLQDTVIAISPLGGANYNIINADRRVSDVYGVSNTTKGFVIGWGYRSHPTATAAILTESFALVLVKSVTQKANGQYVITFDIKGPAADQRAAYSATTIAPYAPYPL